MSEVVVRLRPDVYEQLQKRAAAQERELTDVIAEAVEHWLEEDVEGPHPAGPGAPGNAGPTRGAAICHRATDQSEGTGT
jgi:hypothetical protein